MNFRPYYDPLLIGFGAIIGTITVSHVAQKKYIRRLQNILDTATPDDTEENLPLDENNADPEEDQSVNEEENGADTQQ